ncbi:MAG: hypothetical protein ABIF84_00895 [Patescibacteria group bacterium]
MWERIKKILEKEGGKCIIIEQGQPSYLVMRLEDYEKGLKESNFSEIDKVNQDITQWKAEEEIKEESVVNQPSQEVKVEDLPF